MPLTLLLSLGLVLSGRSGLDSDGSGSVIVDRQDDSTGPADGAGGGDGSGGEAAGTRQQPLPTGTTVSLGDWQARLRVTIPNATAQVDWNFWLYLSTVELINRIVDGQRTDAPREGRASPVAAPREPRTVAAWDRG